MKKKPKLTSVSVTAQFGSGHGDIVERLRDRDSVVLSGLYHAIPAMQEAANEIERLRAEVERLKAEPRILNSNTNSFM